MRENSEQKTLTRFLPFQFQNFLFIKTKSKQKARKIELKWNEREPEQLKLVHLSSTSGERFLFSKNRLVRKA